MLRNDGARPWGGPEFGRERSQSAADMHEFAGSRPVDKSAVLRLAAENEDRIL
jgi:hypothetical protein